MNTAKKTKLVPASHLRVAYLNLPVTNKFGIDNIKKSFDVVIDISELAISLSKVFDYKKLFTFAFRLAEYGNVVDVLKQALAEFGDLNAVEAQQVSDHFKEKFDIENDTLESLIERGIDIIERGYQIAPVVIEYGGDLADYVGEVKRYIRPVAA